LLVDSGNVLFKNRDGLQLPSQEHLSARAILDIYSALGYDAMAVGPYDLAGGLDLLIDSRMEGTPWISTDLVDKSGDPVFPPWIIREKDGSRIGILGLTGKTRLPAGYAVRHWGQALAQYVEALFPACDFLILLSNLDDAANTAIAEAYPQIQLIISASRTAGNVVPRLYNNTVFTQSHLRGKYLGILNVTWPNHAIWRDTPASAPAVVPALFDLLEKGAAGGGEEPVRQKTLRLMTALGAIQTPDDKPVGGSYTYSFMSLSEQIRDTEWVKGRIRQLKAEIAAANRTVQEKSGHAPATGTSAAPSKTQPFAGAESCRQCHAAQYRKWRKTAHADSVASLVREQQQYNPSCLACHVTRDMTGTAMPQPALDLLRLPDSLKTVGCESCHGAGQAHIDAGGGTDTLRPVSRATCTACHTEEMDSEFSFQERLARLGCTD